MNQSATNTGGAELMTPQELAAYLDIRLNTVYTWTHQNMIPYVKVGRLLRFRRSDVNDWLSQRSHKAHSRPNISIKQLN